jgi:glycosyltransferase involved in cell wall biosynthesis
VTGAGQPAADRPVVALLPGYPTIEDFLDPLSLTIDDFVERMDGGWLFGYAAALATAGVDSVVVCFSPSVNAAQRRVHAPTGATILLVPSPRRVSRLRSAPGLIAGPARHAVHLAATPVAATLRALASEGVAAIVCQEYEYPRFEASLLIGRRLRVPVFASFQGASRGLSPFERPLRQRTVRAATGLIVAAREERERIATRYGVEPDRIAAIFNPLDLDAWAPSDRVAARDALDIPHEAAVVAWHGRVEIRKKGLDVLLDAWRSVRERLGDRAILLLLGSGQDAAALRALLEAVGADGVRWHDEYVLDDDRVRRHLAAADVFAFASREEGMPVALLEAMACGVPVVAGDVPGVSDVLEGGGGRLVPRDDPSALADEIVAVVEDGDQAADLGHLARRRVEEAFSLDAVGAALRAFILPGR